MYVRREVTIWTGLAVFGKCVQRQLFNAICLIFFRSHFNLFFSIIDNIVVYNFPIKIVKRTGDKKRLQLFRTF